MKYYTKNYSVVNLAVLSLLIGGVIYFAIWSPTSFRPFFSAQNHSCPQSSNPSVPKDELEGALEKASMANKTLIIAVVNKAYVEETDGVYPTMLDLFLESFWVGEETRPLLDHLLLVAVDGTSYDRCKFRRLNCYRLVTDGVDFAGEKLYMSEDFIKMMWTRTLFLLNVLRRGYSFIFTDTDVMWLRNPFERLSRNKIVDLQVSTDWYHGDPWSENNSINTGFYFIRSNNRTISLFEIWYSMKINSPGMKEQDVLVSLTSKGVLRELGLRVKFLDTLYFSGFCSDSNDVGVVTTVHANCCRSINAKVVDLRAVLRDWKEFRGSIAANANGTTGFRWSGHNACSHSW